jgi:hypothetical protein
MSNRNRYHYDLYKPIFSKEYQKYRTEIEREDPGQREPGALAIMFFAVGGLLAIAAGFGLLVMFAN